MTEIMKREDLDPTETREWIESIDSVLKTQGAERAHYLLEQLIDYTRRSGAYLPFRPNTAYVNTISPGHEPSYPGNREFEKRIEAFIRWNALAMVLNANKVSSEYGGHLSTYASSATLYEVGFNHFWRAASDAHPGDMVFVQGHASPGIYARAFLEGRLSEDQLKHFRQEATGDGLSSYPHPWLMPNFWQFPTVSMGLGPMMAIYQARFLRYMENRDMVPASDRKVWAFLGDGEMDEPESMGALTLPVREKLDNLVFVVNCNLQRLDGPVRGNGKIIQELEAAFLGAGWNVIKVVWGNRWDPLLARDTQGLLQRVMEECVDGEYQNFKAKGGAYTREHFFGKYPELKEMVANMSDDDIWRLNRGGHDARKVFAAYSAAMNHKGQPTVILAKTVKGFGLGKAAEGQMVAHQQKKLDEEALRAVRDRFNIPLTDEQVGKLSLMKPADDSPEMKYLHERRAGARRLSTGAQDRGEAAGHPGARPRSAPCSRARAIARSRPPWPSCASSRCCSRTRTSARTSCPSFPTRRARSAWKACSARSASTARRASSIRRSIPTSSCPTARTRKARCSKRASTKRAPPVRGSRRARPTRITARTWCRSTSTTRCSASSASATSTGPRAICARADSC